MKFPFCGWNEADVLFVFIHCILCNYAPGSLSFVHRIAQLKFYRDIVNAFSKRWLNLYLYIYTYIFINYRNKVEKGNWLFKGICVFMGHCVKELVKNNVNDLKPSIITRCIYFRTRTLKTIFHFWKTFLLQKIENICHLCFFNSTPERNKKNNKNIYILISWWRKKLL